VVGGFVGQDGHGAAYLVVGRAGEANQGRPAWGGSAGGCRFGDELADLLDEWLARWWVVDGRVEGRVGGLSGESVKIGRHEGPVSSSGRPFESLICADRRAASHTRLTNGADGVGYRPSA
jgi:hypothetical protein